MIVETKEKIQHVECFNGVVFCEALKKALKFVAKSEKNIRYSLHFVCFRVNKDGLTIASLDGKSLARFVFKGNFNFESDYLIKPKEIKEAFKELKKIKKKDTIEVVFTDEELEIKAVGNCFTFIKQDGKFPVLEQYIPQEYKLWLSVDRNEFIYALKSNEDFLKKEANDKSIPTRTILNVKNNKLSMESLDISIGGRRKKLSIIDCKTNTNKCYFCLNPKLLLDILKCSIAPTFTLKVMEHLLPCYIEDEYKNYKSDYVIMPMKDDERDFEIS